MALNDAQLIIGGFTGEHAKGLASEVQANQEASPSIHAHAKYLQEVISGRMSPQEAALRARIEEQSDSGGLAAPQSSAVPGGVSVNAGDSTAVLPKTQRMGGGNVARSSAVSQQSPKMTNRDAATIVPSLTDIARTRAGSRGSDRDFMGEIKERGNQARETEGVKGKNRKEIAEFNAAEKMNQIREQERGRNKRLMDILGQRGEHFDRTEGYKYYALEKRAAQIDEQMKILRESKDQNARINAFKAISGNINALHKAATQLGSSINADDEETKAAIQSYQFSAKLAAQELEDYLPEMQGIITNGGGSSKSSVEKSKNKESKAGPSGDSPPSTGVKSVKDELKHTFSISEE